VLRFRKPSQHTVLLGLRASHREEHRPGTPRAGSRSPHIPLPQERELFSNYLRLIMISSGKVLDSLSFAKSTAEPSHAHYPLDQLTIHNFRDCSPRAPSYRASGELCRDRRRALCVGKQNDQKGPILDKTRHDRYPTASRGERCEKHRSRQLCGSRPRRFAREAGRRKRFRHFAPE